jgi:hypothetical protein
MSSTDVTGEGASEVPAAWTVEMKLEVVVPPVSDVDPAEHHDPYEKSAPEHNWWDWYAAYLNPRLEGSGSEEATKAAGVYMEGVLGAR